MTLIPVVIAGGSGTRLWPLSRESFPKQFLSLADPDKSLLEQTVVRVTGLCETDKLIVVCNEAHRFIVGEQLHKSGLKSPRIILEPEGRNTAPAIALAAMEAKSLMADVILLVLPADHFIRDIHAFQTAVGTGVSAAQAGDLVVFGVPPTQPETGYGYIRTEKMDDSEVMSVLRFVEKPDATRAAQYLTSGEYLWNSGIFLFRAEKYLEALQTYAPDILDSCQTAFETAQRDLDFIRPGRGAFLSCRADSIDYAVMEHTDHAKIVVLQAGWSDLGSWETLQQVSMKDDRGNAFIGDVLGVDCENSYVRSESRLVAALGLKNHLVVETPDAVLVADRKYTWAVKELVEQLRKTGRVEGKMHRRIFRPWGWYETIADGTRFQVKRLHVKPGAGLSLQMHQHRAEHWVVVSGEADIVRDNEHLHLGVDQSTYIPLGAKHRLSNSSDVPLEIVEIQTGSEISEEDIVRFEDHYGRVENP